MEASNVEMLDRLPNLEALSVGIYSLESFSFLHSLPNTLTTLFLGATKSKKPKLTGLGRFTNLKELYMEGLANLKYLELWQIRGLSDISFISTLSGLQYLFLQSLRNVTELPDLSGLTSLRRVYLETMKGLNDVSGLIQAPALEEYIHVCAQNMSPEQYSEMLENKTLKSALFGFGSDKKNQKMERLMKYKGIKQYSHQPFNFI